MPWKDLKAMNLRKEFALKAIQTSNFRELCQEYGISTKTGYKWRERLILQGYIRMGELSRRPRSHANQLAEAVVCEIVKLKNAHPPWGPRKVRAIYQRLHDEVPSGLDRRIYAAATGNAAGTSRRRSCRPCSPTGCDRCWPSSASCSEPPEGHRRRQRRRHRRAPARGQRRLPPSRLACTTRPAS